MSIVYTYRDKSNPQGKDMSIDEFTNIIKQIMDQEQKGKKISELRSFGNDEGLSIIFKYDLKQVKKCSCCNKVLTKNNKEIIAYRDFIFCSEFCLSKTFKESEDNNDEDPINKIA